MNEMNDESDQFHFQKPINLIIVTDFGMVIISLKALIIINHLIGFQCELSLELIGFDLIERAIIAPYRDN